MLSRRRGTVRRSSQRLAFTMVSFIQRKSRASVYLRNRDGTRMLSWLQTGYWDIWCPLQAAFPRELLSCQRSVSDRRQAVLIQLGSLPAWTRLYSPGTLVLLQCQLPWESGPTVGVTRFYYLGPFRELSPVLIGIENEVLPWGWPDCRQVF